MSNEERDKGSVLIAKFLGWTQGFIGEWSCPFEPSNNGFKNIYAPNGYGMKFHTDWNWLMEAAKKFDDLKEFFGTEHETMYITRCDNQDSAITCYNISQAFEVLVDNINWYNLVTS